MSVWRTKILIFVILTTLFYQFASAQPIPTGPGIPTLGQTKCILTGTTIDFGSCITASLPIALIAILVSISFGAIAYMAGEIFNVEGLKGWYKSEAWETVKSILIIVAIFSILIIISGLANALTGPLTTTNKATLATLATCPSPTSKISSNLVALYCNDYAYYIYPQLFNTESAFAAVFGLSVGISTLKSIELTTWFPIPIFPPVIFASIEFGSTAQIYSSNYLSTSALDSSITFLKNIINIVILPVLFIFEFQKDLFPILVPLGFGVLLPIGIILRSVPFLREIGGTMIALAVGISIIYPTLLLMLNLPLTNYLNFIIPLTNSGSSCPFSQSSSLLCILFSVVNIITGLITSSILSVLIYVPTATNPSAAVMIGNAFNAGLFVGIASSFNSIYPTLNLVLKYTVSTILQLLLFLADLLIGISVTNAIAHMLGGRIRTSLGRLKLT